MSTGRLKGLLAKFEGFRLKPYIDTVGKTTIGIGRNLSDVGITLDEAYYLLQNDINSATIEADKFPWFKDLEDVRKDVIISMIFNMGSSKFLQFKNMHNYLSNKNYSGAAKEMLNSQWASQVKDRALVLSQMMESNSY